MSEFTKGELELCSDSLGLAQIEGKTIFVVFPSMCNTPEDLVLRIANSKELVLRWNSQPDLLEACKKLLLYSNCNSQCADRKEAEKLAKVAIAKTTRKRGLIPKPSQKQIYAD